MKNKILSILAIFAFLISVYSTNTFAQEAQQDNAEATEQLAEGEENEFNEEGDEMSEDQASEEETEQQVSTDPLDNVLILELEDGNVIIELKPEVAPKHVARIKELTRQGFYNGVVFHRVIEGFMAQTGDPTGTGRGGSGKNLDAEFSSETHVRGTVSMARASDPNSADSQFFIMFDEAPHLDGNYTVFGQVIEGMDNVDKITKGFGPNGMVSEPDSIISIKVAADLLDEELPASVLALRDQEEESEGEESDEANGDEEVEGQEEGSSEDNVSNEEASNQAQAS